jgi:hypothetical protein
MRMTLILGDILSLILGIGDSFRKKIYFNILLPVKINVLISETLCILCVVFSLFILFHIKYPTVQVHFLYSANHLSKKCKLRSDVENYYITNSKDKTLSIYF